VSRTNRSARQAGARFERQVADHLAQVLQDDRIDRRVKTGTKDCGDIAGVRHFGRRVVIEVKNTTRLDIATHLHEANVEAGNDDALAGVLVQKRRGVGDIGQQLVCMDLDTLARLLGADPALAPIHLP
jgi:hypothetical protein